MVIGEGGSGGAIAIATANRVLMLEHAIYAVISPEGAASILWRDSARAKDAATTMKITAQDLKQLGVIDDIVREPAGGAHRNPAETIAAVGAALEAPLERFSDMSPRQLRSAPSRQVPVDWPGDLTGLCGCSALFLRMAGRVAARTGSEFAAVRWLLVLLPSMALAGCLSADRALEPLPRADHGASWPAHGLALGAPLYVRIFKAESEMEVWLGRSDGEYVLFRTYPICNWSGDLGPKTKEGDKQAPEGFYMVSTRQMNPQSA